jgi:CheY-like chemotaxis protein
MECSRQIRAMEDEQKSKTPIIAITGNAKNYSPEDFSAAGINDFMPKPIDFDLLVQKVKEFTGSEV